MKKEIILVLMMAAVSGRAFAQSKQATHISLSAVCSGQLSNWDNERAVLNFNTSSQTFTMISDLYEMTEANKNRDGFSSNEDFDGLPISLNTRLSINNLDFKTSANNGETFVFNTLVKCNGREISIPATYTFFYAPRVAENNLNGAPLCSFRLDFVLSIQPKDFGLEPEEGCNEIVLKVQDGLLNKID